MDAPAEDHPSGDLHLIAHVRPTPQGPSIDTNYVPGYNAAALFWTIPQLRREVIRLVSTSVPHRGTFLTELMLLDKDTCQDVIWWRYRDINWSDLPPLYLSTYVRQSTELRHGHG
jgi:hypothetical protein